MLSHKMILHRFTVLFRIVCHMLLHQHFLSSLHKPLVGSNDIGIIPDNVLCCQRKFNKDAGEIKHLLHFCVLTQTVGALDV